MHKKDSIDYTQHKSRLAEKYIKSLLGDSIVGLTFDESTYDEDLNAYKVTYTFRFRENDRIRVSDCMTKNVWVDMNFRINNGDYQMNPKIVKVTRILD